MLLTRHCFLFLNKMISTGVLLCWRRPWYNSGDRLLRTGGILKKRIFCLLPTFLPKWRSWKYYFNNSNDNKNYNSSSCNNNHNCWNCYLRKNRKVTLEIFHSDKSSSPSQYQDLSMTREIALLLRLISDSFRTSLRKNVQSGQTRKMSDSYWGS